jgi:hypothetical protein
VKLFKSSLSMLSVSAGVLAIFLLFRGSVSVLLDFFNKFIVYYWLFVIETNLSLF